MKFYPLAAPMISTRESQYLKECVDSGWVSSAGPWVNRFETTFASQIGTSAAVAVSSGTAALHLALIATNVSAGSEVIVPTLTFIAPINCVKYVNAHPVFMDCDEHLNINVEKVEAFLRNECVRENGATINKRTGRRVSALIVVHVFGNPARIWDLKKLCSEFQLTLIEDATEALGSYFVPDAGEPAHCGLIGDVGCFSFNGNKVITTGSGGMVVSRDQNVLKKVAYLSTQAKDDDIFYVHNEVGFNYRLSSIQAAFGLAQLEGLENILNQRRQIHAWYSEVFAEFNTVSLLQAPIQAKANYWLNALVFQDLKGASLKELVEKLAKRGVQTRPIWKLNHEQLPYKDAQSYEIEYAPKVHPKVLNIPSSSDLTKDDVIHIARQIREVIGQ